MYIHFGTSFIKEPCKFFHTSKSNESWLQCVSNFKQIAEGFEDLFFPDLRSNPIRPNFQEVFQRRRYTRSVRSRNGYPMPLLLDGNSTKRRLTTKPITSGTVLTTFRGTPG